MCNCKFKSRLHVDATFKAITPTYKKKYTLQQNIKTLCSIKMCRKYFIIFEDYQDLKNQHI